MNSSKLPILLKKCNSIFRINKLDIYVGKKDKLWLIQFLALQFEKEKNSINLTNNITQIDIHME